LVRQVVDYESHRPPGTVIIDTKSTFLYLVLNDRQAMRYGIGVGREGFTWSGEQVVARKTEWPDWRPPAEMVSRQPYLPRFMAGGPGNPLGARAMYLWQNNKDTLYRIHGTVEPWTIGKSVSSGCIRMINQDVIDLYQRATAGAKVIVLASR
jgi:lipoprotein-anchoring transpeptidase ErfK/SrfK